MELIQLCMKTRGIRFFAKIPKKVKYILPSDKYKCFYKKEPFLAELAKRENEYDIILITSHGAEDSIIVPITQYDPYRQEHPERSNDNYKKYITINDTHFFRNNFVFAVSCLTAQEFGPEVVKKGVITYLGYDVLIQNLFNVSNICMSSRVRELYETVVKRIFVNELVQAITMFLNDMLNVSTLKQLFAFRLEKCLLEFFSMDANEVSDTYGLRIKQDIWNKNKQKLQVQQLNFLNEINRHLIIIGDPEYISLYGIENGCKLNKQIYEKLRKVSFENKDYEMRFKDELEHLIKIQGEKW